MFSRKSGGLCFTIALLFAAASPASAAGPISQAADDYRQSRTVTHVDLDLRQVADQRVLDRRVKSAAHALCKDVVTTISFYQYRWERRCRSQIIESTREQVASAIQRAQLSNRVSRREEPYIYFSSEPSMLTR